jgi:hypothetical protein
MGIVLCGHRLDLRFPENAVIVPALVAKLAAEQATARKAA